jgi:3-hydroxyacyl-[acyl-carrier-protein] dehydratase
MRFRFIDRIVEIQPSRSIVAIKQLRPDEDYLRDHFPQFPVMPGVLMLESMFQASMWLVRHSEQFRSGVVVLKEARNIKFADFVVPGRTLRIAAEITKQDARFTTLKAEGTVDGATAVSGRVVLERFNKPEGGCAVGKTDLLTRRFLRREFKRIAEGIS